MTTRTWTEDEVRALGVRTDLETACSVWQIGRTRGYELARAGEFPSLVLRIRGTWVVPVAPMLRALGIDPAGQTGPSDVREAGVVSAGPEDNAPPKEPVHGQHDARHLTIASIAAPPP